MVALTPTANRELPFRTSGFSTLVEGLDYAAQGETGLQFLLAARRAEDGAALSGAARAGQRSGPAPAVRKAAPRRPGRDRRRDLTRLRHLLLRLPVCRAGARCRCRCASISAAATPTSSALRGMLVVGRGPAAVAPPTIDYARAKLRATAEVDCVATAERNLLRCRRMAPACRRCGPDEPCYIQYSSGSTSFPRGVLVTQRAIAANARAIARDGMALRAGDRCTSWLPLYHDMGLVGCCLTPVMAQITVDYLPSTAFARRPLLWLKLCREPAARSRSGRPSATSCARAGRSQRRYRRARPERAGGSPASAAR